MKGSLHLRGKNLQSIAEIVSFSDSYVGQVLNGRRRSAKVALAIIKEVELPANGQAMLFPWLNEEANESNSIVR